MLRVQAEGEVWKFTRASTRRARDLYRGARDLDPLWPVPWGCLAWACWFEAKEGWTDSREKAIAEGIALAEKAIELGPLEPIGYMQLGNLVQLRGDHERAVELRERAVQLAPSDFGALCGFGAVLLTAGFTRRALQMLKRAAEVAPRYPPSLCALTAFAHLVDGDDQAALEMAERAIARGFESTGVYGVAAMAHAASGRPAEAKACLDAALQINPKYTVREWMVGRGAFRDRAAIEGLSSRLAKAGLPP